MYNLLISSRSQTSSTCNPTPLLPLLNSYMNIKGQMINHMYLDNPFRALFINPNMVFCQPILSRILSPSYAGRVYNVIQVSVETNCLFWMFAICNGNRLFILASNHSSLFQKVTYCLPNMEFKLLKQINILLFSSSTICEMLKI